MLSFFPLGVLDEILNLIESVSEEFPSYSYTSNIIRIPKICFQGEAVKNMKKKMPQKTKGDNSECTIPSPKLFPFH